MFPINRWWACLGALILAGLCCNCMLAQMTTGAVGGALIDASDASVPGAQVSLVSEGTGETRKAVSGPGGEFLFSAIQPGTYTLSAEKAGFKGLKLKGI